MEIAQDMYSSASSDDQGSINSVIHLTPTAETTESDSAPPTPERLPRMDGQSNGHRTDHVKLPQKLPTMNGLHDDDDSSSEDEEDRRRAHQELDRDSDSSTSSEETQIWVPNNNTSAVRSPVTNRPQIPPKPGEYTPQHGPIRGSTPVNHRGLQRSHSNNNSRSNTPTRAVSVGRQSIVSQNSVGGRIETVLLREEVPNGADSGISNESPEVVGGHHSSAESGCHSQGSHHSPQSQASSTSAPHLQHLGGHLPHSGTYTAPGNGANSSHNGSLLQAAVAYQSAPPHSHSHIISLQPLASPQPSPLPSIGSLKPGHANVELAEMQAHFRECLFNILSGLYALFLVVVGVTLPIAEVLAGKHIAGSVIETFYIYLFICSILFLVYVYIFLLRSRKRSSPRCRHRGLKSGSKAQTTEDPLLNKSVNSSSKCRWSISSSSHTGSFYLRLGAVAFGIGTMIHEGLMFGQLFEMPFLPHCLKIVETMRPIVHLIFTFVQLYFIFLNSKMRIHKYRVFARFGLMHMIATNLCVWLRAVIMETLRDINQNHKAHSSSSPNGSDDGKTFATIGPTGGHPLPFVEIDTLIKKASISGDKDPSLAQAGPGYSVNQTELRSGTILPQDCVHENIMGKVVEDASPYLYPCTIEYSLICAGILYVMWRNICRASTTTPIDHAEHNERTKKQNRVSVDCSGANRGLFFGIFTLVAVIICVIVFFVLVEKPGVQDTAFMIMHISEIALYILALVAVLVAACKIRSMTFHRYKDNALDETLLVVSLVGVFMYCIFGAIAGRYNIDSMGGLLLMVGSLLILIQSVVQTVFILNGLRRSARTSFHETKKPGREYITFLLVSNIAMWGINTFEVLKSDSNPVAMEFYGFMPWSIITHITIPLAIFFRFHSTVCLASIWKNAYKLKVV